ncbi:MAG: hypothetical protein P9L91_10485 [Candidatus Zophobacter franzmannii]|nr:hypothetical protein [Candidatus Zophobacter franzmannii]
MERDLANGEEDNPQTPLKWIICRGIKPAMQVQDQPLIASKLIEKEFGLP